MDTNANYNLAQNPSELFDVYPAPPSTSHHNTIVSPGWGKEHYPHPKATGEMKERGQVHKDGDWHRSVQAWIVQPESQNNAARVLLQRRSPYKDTHPNQLDVSCAGHVNAGDDILDTMMRELEEELGGNGIIQKMYSSDDVERARAFTVASAVKGETEQYGKFICREYQEVFILWWKGKMETNMFAPLVAEEVSGFEILDGRELIKRMRRGDAELVPRCTEYIDALAEAIGCG
ncbi:hypothetical protein ACHAXT_006925 [Thalassiosira profunda]